MSVRALRAQRLGYVRSSDHAGGLQGATQGPQASMLQLSLSHMLAAASDVVAQSGGDDGACVARSLPQAQHPSLLGRMTKDLLGQASALL